VYLVSPLTLAVEIMMSSAGPSIDAIV